MKQQPAYHGIKTEARIEDLVLKAIEREQQRVGALLHETLFQTLAGVSIQVEMMTRRLLKEKRLDVSELTELENHIHEAIDAARGISGSLRGRNLEEASLTEHLGQLADATAKVVPCEYVCEEPVFVKDAKTTMALMRIAEEAISNILKHADAKQITVTLTRPTRALTLKIQDDGKGFVPREAGTPLSGIDLMQRYARAVGAKLEIKSTLGHGTIVRCHVRCGD